MRHFQYKLLNAAVAKGNNCNPSGFLLVVGPVCLKGIVRSSPGFHGVDTQDVKRKNSFETLHRYDSERLILKIGIFVYLER